MPRCLFERQYDMIVECTHLEDLMPSYKSIMHELGSIIRNKVWNKSDEKILADILFCLNSVMDIVINAVGEHIDFARLYVKSLIKYWRLYALDKYEGEYDSIYQKIHSVKADEIMKMQWDRINSYYEEDYSDDDIYGKRFTEILDDFISNVDDIAAKEFFVEEKNLGRLVRARRGNQTLGEDIVPPSIAVAKEKNIINRWNPPEKRYTYLVVESNDVSPDEVCLEEIRSQTGENVTLVDFKIKDNIKKKRLLNLAYEGVCNLDIESEVSSILNDIVKEEINQVKENLGYGARSVDSTINNVMKANEGKVKTLANIYVGRMLLSTICRVIFVPLDKDEDVNPDLKNRCYKSFHVLAQFLEEHKFDGVMYPSTRMMLKGKKGVNVVLFEPEDVEPIQETIRHVIR